MVTPVFSSLTLRQAEAITDAAMAHGKESGFQALTVVVLDSGGQIVVAKRGDGNGIVRFEVALGKAWGALGMGLDARVIGQRLGQNAPFLCSIVAASGGRVAPNAGGLLILNDAGQAIGAIGISGDTGDNDELCAAAGIDAAGLKRNK